MQPDIELNWPAIAVEVVVSFVLGSVWYGVVVRDLWQRAMGFTGSALPTGGEAMRGSVINIVGTILTAYVLARLIGAWRPAAWGGAAEPASDVAIALMVGSLVWAGFAVPILLNGVAFERKRWTVLLINAAFQLVSVLAMALILAFWD